MRSSRTVLTSRYVRPLSLTLIACAALFLFVTPGRTADSSLIISEFRLRGPNGANDEFIEIYNNTDSAHVVTARTARRAMACLRRMACCASLFRTAPSFPRAVIILAPTPWAIRLPTIRRATQLPPSPTQPGPPTSPTTRASPNTPVLGNRLDAAGASSVVNTLFHEGAGLPALIGFSILI